MDDIEKVKQEVQDMISKLGQRIEKEAALIGYCTDLLNTLDSLTIGEEISGDAFQKLLAAKLAYKSLTNNKG